MTTTQQLVVGIFRDRAQAEQAINELLQAGFDNHQIRFAEQGTSTGGILDKIKSVFTGQDMSTGGIYDDLVKMGAPAEDARYYQSEFEAGRSIVAVVGTAGMQQAGIILAQHGGYGANQRFAQSANHSRSAGVQQPATEDTTGYNRQHLQQQEVRNTQEAQQKPTSNAYYDLVSVLYHTLQAEQSSAAYVQDAQQSGNQDLVQFFDEVHENASRQADRARQLLGSASASRGSTRRSDLPEQSPSYARAGSSYSAQNYRSEQERRSDQDYRSEQERRAEQERHADQDYRSEQESRSQESHAPSS
jgi:hypothetical protein